MITRPSLPFKHLWLALLGGVLLLPGCINGVSWLPDSSGFVYTTSKGELILFDLKSKSKKTLVANTKSNTYWPAVSRDGKRIACASLKHERGKQGKLQIVLFDLTGKEVHRSPTFAWGAAPDKDLGEDDGNMTQLFWAPEGDKILVYGSTHGTHGTTGIYDPATQRMATFPRSAPAAFGASPIRPDGKGFLLASLTPNGEKLKSLAVVAWDGKEKNIDLKFDVEREDNDNTTVGLMLVWPMMRASHWQDNVAVLTSGTTRIRIDTEKGVATLDTIDRANVSLGDQLIWQQHTFADKSRVVVLTPPDKKEAFKRFTIVFIDAKGERRRDLVPAGTERLLGLFPSPDGKHVVVRVWEGDRKGRDADMLVLVNQRGEAVARIEPND